MFNQKMHALIGAIFDLVSAQQVARDVARDQVKGNASKTRNVVSRHYRITNKFPRAHVGARQHARYMTQAGLWTGQPCPPYNI